MPRRLSLRTRLVLGLLVLAAAGLVVADVVTYKAQESFLVDQTDSTLQAEHQFADRAGEQHGPQGGPRQPPGLYVEIRNRATGAIIYNHLEGFPGQAAGSPPRLPSSITLATPAEGQPDAVTYFNAPAQKGGGRYRVRASIEFENPGQL